VSGQRIARGFAWNHLYKLVEYGGITLYSILVVRKFGPELGGNYAVFQSLSGTLAMATAFAVDSVLLRYLPRITGGETKFGHITVEGVRPFVIDLLAFRVFITVVLSLLVAVAFWLLPAYSASFAASLGSLQHVWPYIVLFLFGQCLVSFGTFTLIGLLQVKWVFYASVIARTAMIAAGVLLLMTNQLTLVSAVAVHGFAAMLCGLLLLYWVNRVVAPETKAGLGRDVRDVASRFSTFLRKPGHVRAFVLTPFMLYGMTTWGSDMLSTILGRQPDILMMRAILGENARDIGLYEAAARIALMTEYVFLFGLGGTLVSVFSQFAHEDEKRGTDGYARLRQARRDISGFQAVSTTPLFIFMLVFAPLAIQVAYGAPFAGAAPILMVSLAIQVTVVVIFGGGMQITSLVAIGKERIVFKNRLVWGMTNLIVNFFLIKRFGAMGAIVGTNISNMCACATESIIASHYIGQSFQPKRVASILVLVGTSVAISAGVSSLFPATWLPVVRFILSGVLSAGLILLGYTVFRIPEAQKVLHKFKSLLGYQDSVSLST
jgi:O-antigen/teichoic acid export membrane protein